MTQNLVPRSRPDVPHEPRKSRPDIDRPLRPGYLKGLPSRHTWSTGRASVAVLSAPVADSVNSHAAQELVDPRVEALVRALVHEAESKAVLFNQFTTGYLTRFRRLGIAPEGYEEYLQAERQGFALLYEAVREPIPSQARIRALTLQIALDARRPISPPVDRFVVRQRNADWEVGEWPVGPSGARSSAHRGATHLCPCCSQGCYSRRRSQS